jgi:hypothetical protein
MLSLHACPLVRDGVRLMDPAVMIDKLGRTAKKYSHLQTCNKQLERCKHPRQNLPLGSQHRFQCIVWGRQKTDWWTLARKQPGTEQWSVCSGGQSGDYRFEFCPNESGPHMAIRNLTFCNKLKIR